MWFATRCASTCGLGAEQCDRSGHDTGGNWLHDAIRWRSQLALATAAWLGVGGLPAACALRSSITPSPPCRAGRMSGGALACANQTPPPPIHETPLPLGQGACDDAPQGAPRCEFCLRHSIMVAALTFARSTFVDCDGIGIGSRATPFGVSDMALLCVWTVVPCVQKTHCSTRTLP